MKFFFVLEKILSFDLKTFNKIFDEKNPSLLVFKKLMDEALDFLNIFKKKKRYQKNLVRIPPFPTKIKLDSVSFYEDLRRVFQTYLNLIHTPLLMNVN